eukprot:gnl/TRDRNA2_/TRDRNA2_146916_c0_seq1.p1 gnl/TRDRNA2_/TRDRNA2_146916_c0~~gnl/TRDRNA2_/TRDRNA2_146916_c0_seq1.p1  ORF type:complete len:125 (-),score=13.04 gnl/TRDRNA2_/TRDRNA2_146916_c0_seq1:39-383(-)
MVCKGMSHRRSAVSAKALTLAVGLFGAAFVLQGCGSCSKEQKEKIPGCIEEQMSGAQTAPDVCVLVTNMVRCVPLECCNEHGDEGVTFKDSVKQRASQYEVVPFNCKSIPACGK